MDKNLQVGLIGYGMGGQLFHAPIISAVDGLILKKIRAVKPEQVNLAEKRYPGVQIVPDTEGILQDDEIDVVVITTPNAWHAQIAKKALEAGKHVVIDKPFTVNLAEANELIALSKKQDKILSVFQSRRFDGDFRTVQKILQTGILGTLVEMESRYDRFRNYLRPDSWKEDDQPGSGLVYDLGSHLIDQSLVLFGLPVEITAFINRQRPGSKIDDQFEIILHYPAIKVTLKSAMLVREQLQRFVLYGSEGIYIKKGMDVQEEALKSGANPLTKTDWGVEPEQQWGTVHTTFNGLAFHGKFETLPGDYRIFYKNIYEAVTIGAPLLVTATDARNVIHLIELAFQSHREKRTIAITPLIHDEK